MKNKYLILVVLLSFSAIAFSQKVILIDDFDTAPKYSSTGDYFLSSNQYFGSTNDTDADVELGYTDVTFFGARQITTSTASITYNNLDITGYSSMHMVIGVAEDDAADGLEDWDSDDSVYFEYQIDNSGSWIKLLSIVSNGSLDSAPQIDTDSDGTGDGIILTADIAEVEVAIPSISGTELDFRIVFNGLSEAEEDIVLEFVALVSEFNLFPIIDITSPSQGQNFANGTSSVDVSYTVAGNADSVEIIINEDFNNPIAGNVNGGTVSIPTADNQSYEIIIEAYVEGYIVDDPDVYFTTGNPLTVSKDEIIGLSVYPNPVKNNSFFITSANKATKSVEVFDFIGKKIQDMIVLDNRLVDVSHLNSGIYILKIKESNKLSIKKLIIK
jgi:hypothetical protein